jgi:hypothetical protein
VILLSIVEKPFRNYVNPIRFWFDLAPYQVRYLSLIRLGLTIDEIIDNFQHKMIVVCLLYLRHSFKGSEKDLRKKTVLRLFRSTDKEIVLLKDGQVHKFQIFL